MAEAAVGVEGVRLDSIESPSILRNAARPPTSPPGLAQAATPESSTSRPPTGVALVASFIESTDAASELGARAGLDPFQYYFVRLGWSDFHFDRVLCRQPRAIECVSNRRKLD